jgi:hypothetical protein
LTYFNLIFIEYFVPLVSVDEHLLAVLEHQHNPAIPSDLGTHHVASGLLNGAQRACEVGLFKRRFAVSHGLALRGRDRQRLYGFTQLRTRTSWRLAAVQRVEFSL